MAPASIAGARQDTWTRDQIIQALRDYAELYGEYFTTAAFNPSVAKWRAQPELRERYLAGNPKTGRTWPSLNTIKDAFDGSFNAAREAAGFAANKPGPGQGKRPAHTVEPIRGVDDRRVFVIERKGDPDAARRVRGLEREVERLAGQLERAEQRSHARAAASQAHSTATSKQRARAERAATDLRETREALTAARRKLAGALADLDATKKTNVGLLAELAAARERAVEVTRERDAVIAALAEVSRDPEPVDESVADARGEARAARDRARVADERAKRAEADRLAAIARAESAEAAAAAARRSVARAGGDALTADEVEQLRTGGPSGPAVFARAVRDVGRYAKVNQREPLRAALKEAASAAMRWRDRL